MSFSVVHQSQEPKRQKSHHESQYTQAYPSRTIVHAKLEMTEPGDHDEQEADAVASTIVSGGKISRQISGGSGGSSGIAVSPQMESQLSRLQGGGRQMPDGLRSMMESGFGRDFSQVRLHTDPEAASMSSSIHAKAFTHGNDIYFNQGQFSPQSKDGQRLVAHELAHVAQGGKTVARDPMNDGPTIGADRYHGSQKKEEEGTTFAELLTNLALFKSLVETIGAFRKANVPDYIGDVINVIHKYNFDRRLEDAINANKLAEAGQGAARAVNLLGKSFDMVTWAISTIFDIKRAYDYRNDTLGLSYYSFRALMTIAGCPLFPLPPIVKTLIAEFNTASGVGDIISEMDNDYIHPYRTGETIGDFYGGADTAFGKTMFLVGTTPVGWVGEKIGETAAAAYLGIAGLFE